MTSGLYFMTISYVALAPLQWCHKVSHSSSVSGSNRLVSIQIWKKVMGWYTAQ